MTNEVQAEGHGFHQIQDIPALTSFFPGNYAQDFESAMRRAGLSFKGELIADGAIHRFATGPKGHKNGWYVFYGMAGAFGDWSQDIHVTWSLNNDKLPPQHRENLSSQIKRTQRIAEVARVTKHEETAVKALGQWNTLSMTATSPYLLVRQVEAFGIRFSHNCLVIPIKDITGKLWSLQWIKSDGAKYFFNGGRKKGCFHEIGSLEDGKPIIITEGYATAASVHMATQKTVVIAFDAGNLDPVIEELKRAYPKSPLIIAGDDDRWKETNTGRQKAIEAVQKFSCSVVFPQFKNTENKPTDFNDLHVLEGLDTVKSQIEQVVKPLEWPELQPIRSIKNPLPPVIALPPELIPEPYQDWLWDIADRMQCPLDYVAVGAVVVTASLIGAGCSIRPKRLDSWTVIPNLWGGIVGAPSTLKTPALKEILRPIEILEKAAMEAYEKDLQSYDVESEAHKAIKEVIKKEMARAANDEDDFAMQRAKQKCHALQEPSPPLCKRYSSNDATIEKMHELLSQNHRGLLLFRDELMGLLKDWDRQGREGDRAFYLEAWNGYGSKTTDRIGRGTIHTKNLCISLLGSTQPSKLMAYFQQAMGGKENDGLLQRFQLFVYPDQKPWQLIDRKPNEQARESASQLMIKLATMDFCQYGAMLEESSLTPYFHFEPQAQEIFYEWLTDLEDRLESSSDEPILTEHLTKYRKLMPSLALIFHLINIANGQASGPVTLDCVERAAGWCDYLESHARRIYDGAIDSGCQAARNLGRRIQNGELRGSFDLRDIYRKQWTSLKTKEEAEIACDLLSEAGWLREKTLSEGRKMKKCYFMNPNIKIKQRPLP